MERSKLASVLVAIAVPFAKHAARALLSMVTPTDRVNHVRTNPRMHSTQDWQPLIQLAHMSAARAWTPWRSTLSARTL